MTDRPDVKRRIAESGDRIRHLLGRERLPQTLVVLGSGFKGFEGRLTGARAAELAAITHFPVPRVEGHGASLVVGSAAGRELAVLTGRVHLYEDYAAGEVVYPLRTLAALGVTRVLLTNAAGSVDTAIRPGQVVLVRDQLNLTGRSCLAGDDARAFGSPFVDMGAAFDPVWRAAIAKLARATEGVYAGVLGPAYETPAETRMLAALGAHVVGMSTVQEVLAACQLGLKVACLSFVTNMAGGVGQPLSHADVIALVARHRDELHLLIEKAVGVTG